MIQMTFNFGSIEEARDHLARFTGQATPAVSSTAAVPVKAAIASGGPSLPSGDGAAPPVKRGPGRPKKSALAGPQPAAQEPEEAADQLSSAPTPIEAAIDAAKASEVVTHEQMADALKKLVGGTTDAPDFSKPSAILAKYGYVRIKDVKEQHRGAIYADAVAAAAG